MEANSTNVRNEDLAQFINDAKLIKKMLLLEGELTDWAKREIAKAKLVSESECVSHEIVEDMIL